MPNVLSKKISYEVKKMLYSKLNPLAKPSWKNFLIEQLANEKALSLLIIFIQNIEILIGE